MANKIELDKIDFKNLKSGNTPVNDENLNQVQENVEKFGNVISTKAATNLSAEEKRAADKEKELEDKIEELEKELEDLRSETEALNSDFKPNTVSGESAIVNDGVKGSKVEVIGDGNSYQETTEGYNILPISLTSQTINGIDFIVGKDTSVTIKGTPTTGTSKLLGQATLKAGTYTVCSKGMKYAWDTARIEVSGTTIGTKALALNADSTLITLTEEDTIKLHSINIKDKILDYTLYPMIIEGDVRNNLPLFEPYTNGASPNTEYKQDIEVIDMVNLFDIEKQNANCYLQADNGELYASSASNTSDYIKVKANETYLLSFDYSTLYNSSNRAIAFYNTKKEYLRGFRYEPKGVKEVAIIPTEDGYIRFSYDINCYDVMVCKGTKLLPYLPYGHIGLVQRGKNYLKIKDDFSQKGVTLTNLKDGWFKVEGTPTENGNFIFSNSEIENQKNFSIEFLENTSFNVWFWNNTDSKTIITLDKTNNSKTYKLEGLKSVSGAITLTKDTAVSFIARIQVEDGTVKTDFEPYHYEVHSIDLAGNSLAKVGEIKDLLNIGMNGSVSIGDKVIKEYVFTGNENLNERTNAKGLVYYTGQIFNDNNSFISISNRLKNSQVNSYIWNASEYEDVFQYSSSTINQLNILSTINNLTDFKAKLKEWYDNGEPLKILYVTTNKQTINLPSIEPITLFEGTNIFELVTNLGTTLAVTYKVSNKSRLEALENAILSLGGNI